MKNYDEKYGNFFKNFGPALLKVIIIGGFFILIFVIILFSLGKKHNKIDETYNTAICGIIEKKFTYQGSAWIKVNDYPKRYVLKYAYNYDFKPNFLSDFLQIGDSIYKPIHTDSLFIYRNDKEYFFILGNLTLNKNKLSQ